VHHDIRVRGAHGLLDAALWRGRSAPHDELIVFLHGGNFLFNSSAGLEGFFRSMREAGQWLVVERCASGYLGYLPNAADRVHPYATPLNASRLKDLPPTLIFSADDDPLRDEAEAYGIKLIGHGVRTSMLRLPAIALEAQDARAACAAIAEVIVEIDAFLDALPSTIQSPGMPT
jgi:acetyl esterase/lipase